MTRALASLASSADDRTLAFLQPEGATRARSRQWGSPGEPTAIEIAASADDGNEDTASGSVNIVGTTIGFQDNRLAAFRFTELMVSQGDTIQNARIQFTATFTNFPPDNSQAGEITIWCEDTDDAAAITPGITSDISGRTKTTASVVWTMPESVGSNLWVDGERGGNQQTPDLSGPMQEVIDRAGFNGTILFLIGKTSTGDSMVRQVAAFDHATYEPPTLTFSTGTAVTDVGLRARVEEWIETGISGDFLSYDTSGADFISYDSAGNDWIGYEA